MSGIVGENLTYFSMGLLVAARNPTGYDTVSFQAACFRGPFLNLLCVISYVETVFEILA